MKTLVPLGFLMGVMASAAFAQSPLRTWILDSGERFRGELVSYERSVAHVKLEDGSIRQIPAGELSSQDRAHIHAQRRQARMERQETQRSERLASPEFEQRLARLQQARQVQASRRVSVPSVPVSYAWPVRPDLYYYYNGLGIAPFSYWSPAGAYYGGWYRPGYVYRYPRYRYHRHHPRPHQHGTHSPRPPTRVSRRE